MSNVMKMDNKLEQIMTTTQDEMNKMHEYTLKYVNKKTSNVNRSLVKRIRKEHDKITKEIDKKINEININTDTNFMRKIKCIIMKDKHPFVRWALYVDGEYSGHFMFRFSARRHAIKCVKNIKRQRYIQKDLDGGIYNETLFL